VQGLIIFPVSNTTYDPGIWQLQEEHFPLVLIDRYYPDLETDYVGTDNVGGGYRATEHLLILGHQRIGVCLSNIETLQTTSVRDRWTGYCKALEEYGITQDPTLIVPNKVVSKAEAMECYISLLQREDRPDAIFAVNDLVALDVLQAARQCNLRVPDDIALVGFDNLNFAAHVHPPLTTVAQSLTDIGLRAGNLLISRIEGQTGPAKHIELPTQLMIRKSCGARLRIKSSVKPNS
jgi:DNA-binding LacI/PurR family transcriptional regulator